MKQKRYIIYYLADPRDKTIRYIGQSINWKARTKEHTSPAYLARNENPRNSNWINKLKDLNLKPEIGILEEVFDQDNLNKTEIFYIAFFRALGADLHNVLGGGNKPPVIEWTPERRKAKSDSLMGHPSYTLGMKMSPESSEKKRQAMTGFKRGPMSDEHKRKLAIARGGRPFTDESGNLYYNVNEYARSISAHRISVQDVLKGRRPTVKGHSLRYV